MTDVIIANTLINAYKKLQHKDKNGISSATKNAISNFITGRTSGMNLKTAVKLADFVGYEIIIQKKRD